MKKLLFAAFFFIAALAIGSNAFALVDVEGRYFLTTLDSTVKASAGGIVGTDVNLVKDLGVDEKKSFPEGRITLEFGNHRLRYAFMPLKWDGAATLTVPVVFKGQTFPVSTPVVTEMKLDYHRLGYEYDFLNVLSNRFGVIFELKYLNGLASVAGGGFDESKSFSIPIPTVGLAAQAGLPLLFNVGGEITGVTLGKSVYLFDAEAGINYKPAPFVVLSAGYRFFQMHLQSSDDKASLSIKGPFVMLRADF